MQPMPVHDTWRLLSVDRNMQTVCLNSDVTRSNSVSHLYQRFLMTLCDSRKFQRGLEYLRKLKQTKYVADNNFFGSISLRVESRSSLFKDEEKKLCFM